MSLTASEARDIWSYDPETGDFFWKISPKYDIPAGLRAGSFDGKYWRLNFKGRVYKASRVAWLYMTGLWPVHQIDHINGGKADDRFSNLREATNAQNSLNRKVKTSNKLGVKGVHKKRYGFVAQAVIGGRYVLNKQFRTLEAAKAAYDAAVAKAHGQYARL